MAPYPQINMVHQINKMEDKYNMIFSIDAGKALDNIQYAFMIKKKKLKQKNKNTSQQTGYRGNLPQHIRGHISQAHS